MLQGLCTRAAYSDFILIGVNMLPLCPALTPEHQLILPKWIFKIKLTAEGVKEHKTDKLQGAEIFISTFSWKNIHHVRFNTKLICKRKSHFTSNCKKMLQLKMFDIPLYFLLTYIKKLHITTSSKTFFPSRMSAKMTPVPKLNVK